MWLVKYLTKEGTTIYRRYKNRADYQVRAIANAQFKRLGWQWVTITKEY